MELFKSCPFCGGIAGVGMMKTPQESDWNNRTCLVECSVCGATGPKIYFHCDGEGMYVRDKREEENAIRAWNNRISR
jgi:sarcosine oxidase delta subunit